MTDPRFEETLRTYEQYSKKFDEKFSAHFNRYIRPSAEYALEWMPAGSRLLDLGAGTGNHAAFFQSHGIDVLCTDVSPAMLERCKEKGLKTLCGDMETLEIPDASYDGVWAFASLLHLPKERTPAMLAKISRWLVPGGFFGLTLKEGDSEGFEEYENYPGRRRWFSYYLQEEVERYCQPYFLPLRAGQGIDVSGKYRWLMNFWKRR